MGLVTLELLGNATAFVALRLGGAIGRAEGRTVHGSGMQLGGKARFPAAMLCWWAVARAPSNLAVYISLVSPLGLALGRRLGWT